MRKPILMGSLILFALLFLTGGPVSALPVESGGWAKLEYNVTLPTGASNVSKYQHTHAEAGFDIATGTPQTTEDNYTVPGLSSAYAETSPKHSYGKADASTDGKYVSADNWASAGSTPESWGYGSSIYKVSFDLSSTEEATIDYVFTGTIWVNSLSEDGSAFSVALGSIWADDYSVSLWDSDPDFNDYIEVIGIGSDLKNFDYKGTLKHTFSPGSHEIIFTVDTYENAAVPEPTTMLLLGSGLVGFAGFRRKFKK